MDINLKNFIIPKYYNMINTILSNELGKSHYWIHGGRGSQKSCFFAFAIILTIIKNTNVNALVLRKVERTLKNSVYNTIIWAINMLGLNNLFKATTSPLEIVYLPTSQVIMFRGADDPLKLKSIRPSKGYIGITWFEEVDQFEGEEELRSILQSTNRGGDRFWNFYSFNPPRSRDNWTNLYVQDKRIDKMVIHSTYLDVPKQWLGEQFYFDAEHLRETKYDFYKWEYLGIAIGSGGLVFDNLEKRKITPEDEKMFDYVYYGVDFGFTTDPFAFVKVGYNARNRILYVLDEIYEYSLKVRSAVTLIKERINQEFYVVIADSSEPRTIAEFNDYGINMTGARKGQGSVEHGLKFLEGLYKIVIDEDKAPNTWREFTSYEFKKDRSGKYISGYSDKNNHTIDAVRYALEDIMTNNSVKYY